MWFKIVLLLLTFLPVFQCRKICSKQRTMNVLRRSTYDFSVNLLHNVFQKSKFDKFVFSPLVTWLQLTSLAEGAKDKTLTQILNVTKHPKSKCLKRKLKELINKMSADLSLNFQLMNVIIIDKELKVKNIFVESVEKLQSVDVLLYDFKNVIKVSNDVNTFVKAESGGTFSHVIDPEYFDHTNLVSVGMLYYTSTWQTAFRKEFTEWKDFYTLSGLKIGKVNMMIQTGLFDVTYIPEIKSRVLELPCSNKRISLLIFMPVKRKYLFKFFYSLREIDLRTIFHMFEITGKQYLKLELPMFKLSFHYDQIPELLNDLAEAKFKDIALLPISTAIITQKVYVEITEKAVEYKSNNSTTTNLKKVNFAGGSNMDFIANKPFTFMLVDRTLELILFAGMYSEPSDK